MEKISISIGIFQGLFLSLILFLFYNTLLLKNLEIVESVLNASFIDNVAILVKKRTCEENSTVLHDFHVKICKLWAYRYSSKFAFEKYQLSYFTQKRIANLKFFLSLLKQVIYLRKTVIYLNILLKTKLS